MRSEGLNAVEPAGLPVWLRILLLLAVLAATVALVLPATESEARPVERPAPEEVAYLKSRMDYCQVKAIDGKERTVAEDEWVFVAGKHLIHFDCTAATNKTQANVSALGGSVSIRRSWIFQSDLVFTPLGGRKYLAKDFVDSSEREFVWIEEAETREVVAGARPRVLEDDEPLTAAELLEARRSLGTGSTLVVDYKAPKKPVRRFSVEIHKKVVVESSGNEDLHVELEIAPGFYFMKVTVANSDRASDYGERVELDLEAGQTRTLTVKAKPWGRSAVRLR